MDESGQFTKHNNNEYFVIGSFTIGEPRRTAKGFRAFYRKHFPRKMRNQNEIKWSATGISQALRLKTLKYISKLDVRIRYIYFSRNNIPVEYRKENKFKDGLLYTNIVGELLEMYLPTVDQDFRIFCDQRRLSGMTSANFKEIIKARVAPNLSKGSIIQIETVDSVTNINIQIADWISGALARYLEKGHLGEECYAILKGNIIGEGKELFNTPSVHDMISTSIKNKKSLLEQTFFGRSSVLQSGILQLKPQILRGNTEALYKLLLHTSIVTISQT